MNFPEKYLVFDIRDLKDFKNATISGYNKKDVIRTFQNSLINNKVEDSIKWNVELHISCYDKDIWKSIYEIYFKYIHFKNPKLFVYLLKRKKEYDNLILYYPKNHYIFSRNNIEIRNIFCEISCLISTSKKTNIFIDKSLPKININKISHKEIKKRIISKGFSEIEEFIYDDIPNIIKIGLNEIYHNLKNTNGTINNCFYWYILISKIKNDNNHLFTSNELNNNSVINYFIKDNKLSDSKHFIYILWNILDYFKSNLNKNDNILFDKLKYFYFKDFKINQVNNKKNIIFYVFYILKFKINWNISLIPNQSIYIQTNININNMYLNILNNLYKQLDTFQKDLYFEKYYNTLKKYLENKCELKESNKPHKHDLYENLNKIIRNNDEFLSKKTNKSCDKTYSDPDILINKNKTIKDVLDAKEEKKNKKIEFISNFIVPKIKVKNNNVVNYFNNNSKNNVDNIKSINIKKK